MKNREEKENLFAQSHSIEKRKRNFLQILEFREENENFVFKILTIENISRNEHSILQLEIEKNGAFPLEIENLVNAWEGSTHDYPSVSPAGVKNSSDARGVILCNFFVARK